jgi:NAD(P)-dependent dehydrogenase (short-subunit alcohol dehydrogenase family)
MRGKVVLGTGAASGIGRAAALAFAARGARVVAADQDTEGGEDTVRRIVERDGEAIFVHTDVSDDTSVAALLARTAEVYGPLNYAFNNAGIEGISAPTAECTEENWDRVLRVNLKGVWLCMKHEILQMLDHDGGAIVNCSSVAGLVGFASSPAYVASKHGIVGLTRTAALEYATRGIRVNAICPGVIQTPMIDRVTDGDPAAMRALQDMEPMGRIGRPEEVAEAAVWLCCDAASFVTGQALAVDGGFVSR